MPTYDPDYDYTKNDGGVSGSGGSGSYNPLDDTADIDNYTIADNSATSKTAEQIQKENLFSVIPPGDYLLIVHSIPELPKTDFYKANVGDVLMSYEAASVRVRFCLPDSPRQTIEDYFVLPPDDSTQMRAYWEGVPPGKKAVGFFANKFYQFIGSLGYPYPAGGKLPMEARRLGNWKGRTIMATVVSGNAYTDRNGVEKAGRNQVKLFSYRPSEETVEGRDHRSPTGGGGMTGPSGRSQGSQESNGPPRGPSPSTQQANAQPANPAQLGVDRPSKASIAANL